MPDEKRRGRPLSENPKSVKLTVRVEKSEADVLDDYCKRKQISRADGVREAIRGLAQQK